MKPLRICMNLSVPPGSHGGVEQVMIGLSRSLLRIMDPAQEHLVFLTDGYGEEWLQANVGSGLTILRNPSPGEPPKSGRIKTAIKSRFPAAFERLRQLPVLPGEKFAGPAQSDGTIENANIDIIHFPTPGAFLTTVPSVYHPHDLQHIHLPHLFSSRLRKVRELAYPTLCRQAALVAVASTWVKNDLINNYALPPDKIGVVPLAPVLSEYTSPTDADLAATRAKYQLPDKFVFYPAHTFRHKNHIGLIEALAKLRDQGVRVPFVSSGVCNDHFPQIQKRITELHMQDLTQFLGFVSPLEIRCLWQLARAAVIPTRFEAASFPIWEAFQVGTPVACSNVTSLPQQVGDAALVFDPDDTAAIAVSVQRLWTDDKLCEVLSERGRVIVSQFSWDRTARLFQAHYRRIADRQLNDEDRFLLTASPLL